MPAPYLDKRDRRNKFPFSLFFPPIWRRPDAVREADDLTASPLCESLFPFFFFLLSRAAPALTEGEWSAGVLPLRHAHALQRFGHRALRVKRHSFLLLVMSTFPTNREGHRSSLKFFSYSPPPLFFSPPRKIRDSCPFQPSAVGRSIQPGQGRKQRFAATGCHGNGHLFSSFFFFFPFFSFATPSSHR